MQVTHSPSPGIFWQHLEDTGLMSSRCQLWVVGLFQRIVLLLSLYQSNQCLWLSLLFHSCHQMLHLCQVSNDWRQHKVMFLKHVKTCKKGKSLVKWSFKHQFRGEAGFIWSWRSPVLEIKSLSHCLIHTLSPSEGKGATSEEAVLKCSVSFLTGVRHPLFF